MMPEELNSFWHAVFSGNRLVYFSCPEPPGYHFPISCGESIINIEDLKENFLQPVWI